MANSYINENKFEEAKDLYFEVLEETDEKEKVYYNLGIVFRKLHNFSESINYFNKALELNNKYVNAYVGLFETYAYFGDYKNAFKYQEWSFGDNLLSHPEFEISKEKRLDFDDANVKNALLNRFNKKIYKNPKNKSTIYSDILDKIEDKIIFVRSSQGLGDVIQFSYLIKELLNYKPKKIIFAVNSTIYRLLYQLKSSKVDIRLINPLDDEYDYFIPIFSLIKLLEKNNDPMDGWLKIDEKDLTYGKLIIDSMTNKIKIGINWKGNPNHTNDTHRSTTINDILEKANLDTNNNQIFSFQFNPTEEEKEYMKQNNIIDLSSRINDIYDMGMFLSQMNAFISIDSAPIHLAGALGIKSFLLIPDKHEDWRWGHGGDKKWYNTVRIFRT